MAVTKAIDLINRASVILQDPTFTRWPAAELQDWLNDAQKEIVLHRPDAMAVNAALTVGSGLTIDSSKQSLPAAALRLISVIRNVAATSAKKAIRRIERQILDDQIPDWHAKASSINVEHYIYDDRDPKTFYVYPPPATLASIEVVYSSVPAAIALGAFDGSDVTVIGLDDVYANAIVDYMLYRAYSKDAEYAGDSNRAMAHYNAFLASLGVKSQVDVGSSPNQTEHKPMVGTGVAP